MENTMITSKFYSSDAESSLEVFINNEGKIVIDAQSSSDPYSGLTINLTHEELKIFVTTINKLIKEGG
jgi:hypothetical protein